MVKTTSRPDPIVTTLKITDLYPGISPTIGGWEEALLYAGFYFLTAPIMCALGAWFFAVMMGLTLVSKIGWSIYILYWILLLCGLIPQVSKQATPSHPCTKSIDHLHTCTHTAQATQPGLHPGLGPQGPRPLL